MNVQNLNVGDQVGFYTAGNWGGHSYGIARVTKINGHGHIHLDNKQEFDKRGNTRAKYSRIVLCEVSQVFAERAQIDLERAISSEILDIKNTIAASSNTTGRFFPRKETLDRLQTALNKLREFEII